MKPVTCAIAGLGRIGSRLEEDRLREKPATHAGAIVKNPDCVLVAGCDINEDKRKLFEERWGCSNTYENIEEMLSNTCPQILHVATPPQTHLGIVEAAAEHGVPVIVCEKPLAHTEEDARRIAAFHRNGRTKILVNHERRYSKDYGTAKRRVEEGTYGELLSVHSMLYMGRNRDLHDMLLDDGTHLIDAVHFLTGSGLRLVRCERAGLPGRQSLLVTCTARGIPVLFEVASGRAYVTFEIDLVFSEGRIRIGNGIYEEYESGPSPYYEGFHSLLKKKTRTPYPTGYFSNMLADAVLCATERDRDPVSSAIHGYEAIAVITAIKKQSF